MKKLTFISVLIVVIGICFTVNAFADFYVITVKDDSFKVTSTIVPRTGQSKCWDASGETDCAGTGQDGEYHMGSIPIFEPNVTGNDYTVPNWAGERFTDNNDGTITDRLTGLVWHKNANSAGQTDWASALNYCNNLTTGGYTDWRLPNLNELRSLYDPNAESNPTLPDGNPFTEVQVEEYWSSTTYESNPNNAWDLYMNDGYVEFQNKGASYYVWPVRGGD